MRFLSDQSRHWHLPAWLALSGALLVCSAARAQLDTVEIHLDGITVEDGLPQGYVMAMAQDSTGYLWFGTKDGLARYDGYSFTTFHHDPKDTNSIGGDHITSLLVDRTGHLWACFSPFGLDRYDPRTGRFSHVRVEGLEGEVTTRFATRLCADAHNRMWLSAGVKGGWRTMVVQTGEERALIAVGPGELRPPVPPLMDAWVFISPSGDPWIVNADTIRIVRTTADGRVMITDRAHGIDWRARDGVREFPQMVADRVNGQMLVAEPGRIIRRTGDRAEPTDTIALAVQDFQQLRVLDSRGRIWGGATFGSNRRLSLPDGRIEELLFTGVVPPVVLGTHDLTPLFEDRAGGFWLSTAGFGVYRMNLRRERFKPVDRGLLKGLYAANIDGGLLLGFMGYWPSIRYRAPAHSRLFKDFKQVPHPYAGFEQRGAVDDDGRVWACKEVLGSRHVQAVVSAHGGFLSVPALDGVRVTDVFPGTRNTIWYVAHDTQDQVIGLYHIDARTRSVIRQYPSPIAFGSGDYKSISSFTHHPDGSIWMGTVSGLHHLIPGTGEWHVYRHDERDPHSLPHDMVFCTCLDPADPEHVLWVGTNGGGLARFDPRTRQFKTFTALDGLPNDVVYAILSDARNNLWIGTNQGLCNFDPRTGRMDTYTKEDGLPSNEFNRYSYAKADNGELWFEGMGGPFHFNPEEFYMHIPASPTVITGLKLVGKAVAVAGLGNAGGEGYELPAPIEYVRSITLPYSERMIGFSFACMDHTAPLKNTFRYTLDGFNTDWVEVGAAHEATFTNLDPGTYTFRVQGRNSAGVWDERGATVELVITPPWWGTWWFRMGTALLLTGAIVAFYRYRLAQAVKVVRVRERIARDLHDEIGSTLSSVSLFSSVAQKKAAGKAPEASELLGRITDSTTQVLEAMNDIVWAVNADNDDMASVIKRMHAFAVSVSEARGCKLHLHADEELKSWRLEMTQRKNLYLIFKEAVNNAVKYSGCANLCIELQRDHRQVGAMSRSAIVLRVIDDGKGFEPHANNGSVGGGNGLGNMRNRAAEIPGALTITSAAGKGTTVELRFVPGDSKRSLEPMTSDAGRPR